MKDLASVGKEDKDNRVVSITRTLLNPALHRDFVGLNNVRTKKLYHLWKVFSTQSRTNFTCIQFKDPDRIFCYYYLRVYSTDGKVG